MLLFFVPFYLQINFKRIIGIGILVAALVLLLNEFEDTTELGLAEHLIERFEFKNGHFEGDNRSTPTFDRAYEALWGDIGELLFGKVVGAHLRIAQGIQSYKMMIYDLGLIYVLLSLFFFILHGYLSLGKEKKTLILFIILVLFFYYNRPAYLFTPPYFFLLMVAPLYLKNSKI